MLLRLLFHYTAVLNFVFGVAFLLVPRAVLSAYGGALASQEGAGP
ncbi:MAG TPA: hypothetical protein VJQ09_07335 [Candidatus Limnocylindria bacterium]|nr:hypothetical protein [Candidatus Limnocylindria bacterium]